MLTGATIRRGVWLNPPIGATRRDQLNVVRLTAAVMYLYPEESRRRGHAASEEHLKPERRTSQLHLNNAVRLELLTSQAEYCR